jgi:hypothetical protein
MQGEDGDTLHHRLIKFFPITATTKAAYGHIAQAFLEVL